MSKRILLADDHAIVRSGLKTLILSLGPEWQICGEAENGKEAIEKALELKPDLIILDISMPILNGLEAARQIRRQIPEVKIMILSMHDSAQILEEAKKAGADAYVVKSASFDSYRKIIEDLLKPAI